MVILTHMKNQSTGNGNYVITNYSINAYFFTFLLLTD